MKRFTSQASAYRAIKLRTAMATNTITDGSSYFSDPDWTNYPSRYYRLSSP